MSERERVNFLQVFVAERAEVLKRREKAGFTTPHTGTSKSPPGAGESSSGEPSNKASAEGDSSAGGSNAHEAPAENEEQSGPTPARGRRFPVAGLALSGGGMRSASIALGLLQSLYRRGILRHIDFLSTVSGGGYAGGLLSSSILAEVNRSNRIDWKQRRAHSRRTERDRLDIDCDANGPQPKIVQEIARKGESLRRPLLFASRWFWGFLVVNVFVVSGLLTVTAFAAWLFRQLNQRETMIFLQEVGFGTDVTRAFLPALVLLLLWMIAQMVFSHLRRTRARVPDFPAVIFILFAICAVLSLTGLFATRDISLEKLQVTMGWTDETTLTLQKMVRVLGQIAGGLFAISILPLLRPAALLKSGVQPKSAWHRWFFNLASYGVVFGIPTVLFFALSQENISDHHHRRDDRYVWSEVQIPLSDLEAFWNVIEGDQDGPGRELRRASYEASQLRIDPLRDARDGPERGLLLNSRDFANERATGRRITVLHGEIEARDRRTWFFQRWFRLLFHLTGVGNQFPENLADRRRFWEMRRDFIHEINLTCLSNPSLYTAFSRDPGDVSEGAVEGLQTTLRQLDDKNADGPPERTPPDEPASEPPPEQTGDAASFDAVGPEAAQTPDASSPDATGVVSADAAATAGADEDDQPPEAAGDDAESEGTDETDAADTGAFNGSISRQVAGALQTATGGARTEPPAESPDQPVEEPAESTPLVSQNPDVPEWYVKEHPAITHLSQLLAEAEAVEQSVHDLQRDYNSAQRSDYETRLKDSSVVAKTGSGQSLSDNGQAAADTLWLVRTLDDIRETIRMMEQQRHTVGLARADEFEDRLHQQVLWRQRFEAQLAQVRKTNWALLETYLAARGVEVRPPETIFAVVVNDADQRTRLRVGMYSLLVFIVVGLLVPVNPTTLHSFYRDQLADMWIVEDAKQFGRRIPLKHLSTCRTGGPYHIINGALNLFGGQRDPEKDGTVGFLFSDLFCGADRVGYRSTGAYSGGELDLGNAVAISGGAVTPSRIDNVLIRVLLYLLNLRLGQWLPNPSNPPSDVGWPCLLGVLLSYLFRSPTTRKFCFVSDGGHDENTGIGALLQRRCRVIIACDASEDEDYQFLDFQRLHQDAVNKHGVRISGIERHDVSDEADRIDFTRLIPPGKRRKSETARKKRAAKKEAAADDAAPAAGRTETQAENYYIVAKITYPYDRLSRAAGMGPDVAQRQGFLIYIKPTLTGREPGLVRNFSEVNPDFPHDQTLDQFFKEDRFWAYRALGDYMGEVVYCDEFKDRFGDALHGDGPVVADEWRPEEVSSAEGDEGEPAATQSLTEELSDENLQLAIDWLRGGDESRRQQACRFFAESGPRASTEWRRRIVEELIDAYGSLSADETGGEDAWTREAICVALSSVGRRLKAVKTFLRARVDDPTESRLVADLCELLLAGKAGRTKK